MCRRSAAGESRAGISFGISGLIAEKRAAKSAECMPVTAETLGKGCCLMHILCQTIPNWLTWKLNGAESDVLHTNEYAAPSSETETNIT